MPPTFFDFDDFAPTPLHIEKLQRKKARAAAQETAGVLRRDRQEQRAALRAARTREELDKKAARVRRREDKARHAAESKLVREKARAARLDARVALSEERKLGPKPPRMGRHPLIRVYRGLLSRCYTKSNYAYKFYGGRGISVCPRWLDSFWNFVADMGERPEGTSLDRIDNEGDYSPENCRWATREQQYSNVSGVPCYVATIRGKRKMVAEWARELDLPIEVLRRQLRAGVPPEVVVVSAVLKKAYPRVTPAIAARCKKAAEKFCSQSSSPA